MGRRRRRKSNVSARTPFLAMAALRRLLATCLVRCTVNSSPWIDDIGWFTRRCAWRCAWWCARWCHVRG
jgi:hypothetical protein